MTLRYFAVRMADPFRPEWLGSLRREPGALLAAYMRSTAQPRQDNLSQLPSYPDAKMMEITQSRHDFAQRESQL